VGEAGDLKSLRDPPIRAPRPGLFTMGRAEFALAALAELRHRRADPF